MIILDNNNSLPELRLAVRELVDHVLRTGSMGKVSYGSALSTAGEHESIKRFSKNQRLVSGLADPRGGLDQPDLG